MPSGADAGGRREAPCAPTRVPDDLYATLAGYAWARDTVGESGAAVHRLHGKPGAPDLFLKHGTGAVADDVTAEMVRLRWLAPHAAVPALLCFVRTPNEAWLLTTALPGRSAHRLLQAHPDQRPAVVDALARFLRRLHAVPVAICPFTSDHIHRLALARARIDAGAVDEDDFDDERAGWTAERVWTALHDLPTPAADPVVTHGDYSLDNVFLDAGAVVGCIDVGRAGIADRWQDLAIAWHDLGEFGAALQARFLTAYGVAGVDRNKLRFHLLLDELF